MSSMKKRGQLKDLARERIDILVSTALREKQEELAAWQASLAKKIAMRYRVRLPYDIRQLYCKQCKKFIIPGRSARVRTGRSGTKAVRIACLRCGHVYRKIVLCE